MGRQPADSGCCGFRHQPEKTDLISPDSAAALNDFATGHASDNADEPATNPAATSSTNASQAAGHGRLIEQPARIGHGVNERIISHTGFTLSFNRTHMQPNWVAWELTADETEGSTSRSDDFQPDPLLPQPQQVTTADYTRSGYDRGHQCPSADMKWSEQAMRECFYMSNICPQDPQLNRGSWATLEKHAAAGPRPRAASTSCAAPCSSRAGSAAPSGATTPSVCPTGSTR